MIFGTPIPFAEAESDDALRTLLPTSLRSKALAKIAPEVRQRARFSAGVMRAEHLQKLDDGIESILKGATDQATVRLGVKQYLDSIGYQAPDAQRGTLLDLRSDARINLQLETNTQQSLGYGSFVQGQDPAVLDLWPAQELFRAEERATHRNWPAIWTAHGGKLFSGRMIALKNDPIWKKISRFGQPWAPFDYNSGMDLRDITRKEAMALGLIDRDTQVKPQSPGLNDGLQASPEVRAGALREALEASGLGTFNGDGIFIGKEAA